MANIRKRGNTYQITVSLGRDVAGKKIVKTTTFKPPVGLTPKQERKEVEAYAFKFEEKAKNGLIYDGLQRPVA